MVPDGTRCYRMVPDGTRWYQIAPDSTPIEARQKIMPRSSKRLKSSSNLEKIMQNDEHDGNEGSAWKWQGIQHVL